MSAGEKEPSSATESPWFWLLIFSLAALAAIATIGPKFERREEAIETKFHARERAVGREAIERPADDAAQDAPQWQPIFTLGPIAGVVALVAVVAMVNLVRLHRRRLEYWRGTAQESQSQAPPDVDIRPPAEPRAG
jgi:hypothetical protein